MEDGDIDEESGCGGAPVSLVVFTIPELDTPVVGSTIIEGAGIKDGNGLTLHKWLRQYWQNMIQENLYFH